MPRFLQMARLRVEFGLMENSGIQIAFWVDEQDYEFWFSPVIYRNAFARLCEALSALLTSQNQKMQVVTWMERAPTEYDMHFTQNQESIRLEMRQFYGWERKTNTDFYLFFEFVGTVAEICVPFWRALRDLGNKYDGADFSERWGEPFPTREFDELTRELKARGLT